MFLENLEGNILRLKLIQAFQTASKDEVDQIINSNSQFVKLSKSQGPLGSHDLYVLHIAVQVAQLDEIRHLVTKYKDAPAFDLNAVEPQTGNTPLHVAAMYGRSDVVMYLLSFDDIINDTITNRQSKQPVEVARTPELAEAMQVVRVQYVEKIATQMKQYFLTSNIPALEELLSNPRAATLLDINGQDPDTGSTVLHDFVRTGNVPMIHFILEHGGDPLQRNSKGVLPIDLTKNDTIRKILKQSTKSQQVIVRSAGISPLAMQNRNQIISNKSADASLPQGLLEDVSKHPSLLGPPPVMKGFLKKWTNFTGGYKLRWFILENNVLSYYKRQDDTESACRGSINMRQARLHVDSTEKLGFEVLSSTSVKFHLKANHPVETSRWVWALTNAIQYAKDEEKIRNLKASHKKYQGSGVAPAKSGDHTASRDDSSASAKFAPLATHSSGSSVAAGPKSDRSTSFSAGYAGASRPQSLVADEHQMKSNVAKLVQMNNSEIERRGNFDRDEEEDDDEDDEHEDYMTRDEAPFTAEVKSAEDSIAIGLKSIKMVLESLSTSISGESASPEELKKGISSLEQAVSMITTLISQYTSHVASREKYYQTKIDRSNQLQELWEKVIHDMEIEKDKIQTQLHEAIQKKRQANKVLREVAGTSMSYPLGRGKSVVVGSHTGSPTKSASTPGQPELASPQTPSLENPVDAHGLNNELKHISVESESESELEDEFFDALGSGNEDKCGETQEEQVKGLVATSNPVAGSVEPVVVRAVEPQGTQIGSDALPKETLGTVTQDLAKDTLSSASPAPSVLEQEPQENLTDSQRQKFVTIVDDKSFAGYEDGPRKRLTLDDDNRPGISLWGVLKNLIGKDMTRMTLPVSFNECTNLLQRSAEDMEYTDLLDKAASITDDPGERMAYIAAFAASSYSSTIGRVAKPFNPLLGETFEYARPDVGYRMFSEQVSHHPPIGAMMAESPRWDFYGASNVKSKFTGRSFDINPLGLWYITLRPNKGAGVEQESYSFRKVTSTVVGIITGNPVVDQYGDMEITNYTLGYKCLLKFKARGWMGGGAYEVRGTVYDKAGVPQWIVGGHWNDRIFGKKVYSDEAKDITKGKDGDLGEKSNRVLLWRAHERVKTPFNLTSFAVTLNALPQRLGAWLPQTDTRLRPDQRAMEEGRYDEASDEKHRVEEKQRAKRREREAEGVDYAPRWFEKKVHPLSGQEYWSYKGDYWEERKEHDWKDVPEIF